jgi:Tol biopolymer transport system component
MLVKKFFTSLLIIIPILVLAFYSPYFSNFEKYLPRINLDQTNYPLYVINNKGALYKIDLNNGKPEKLINELNGQITFDRYLTGETFVFSNNKEKVLFEFQQLSPFRKDLLMIDFNAGTRKNLTEGLNGNICYPFSFSPDGKRIIFGFIPILPGMEQDYMASKLFMVNSDGSNRINLTEGMEGDLHIDQAHFSPDGFKIFILFWRGYYSSHELWLIDINKPNERKLILKNDSYFEISVSSPKNKAFIKYLRPNNGELMLLNFDDYSLTKIADNVGLALFTPDEKRFLFSIKDPNTKSEILYLINTDGTKRKKLIEVSDIFEIYFLKNNEEILVELQEKDSNKRSIFEVSLDGATINNITEGMDGKIYYNSSSPDGRKIVVESELPSLYRELWIIDLETTYKIKIPEISIYSEYERFVVKFNPNKKRILIKCQDISNPCLSDLYIWDYCNSKLIKIGEDIADAFFLVNGEKILFTVMNYYDYPLPTSLFIANTNGFNRETLMDGGSSGSIEFYYGFYHPNLSLPFSPDGRKVIVSYWSENKQFPDFQVVIIDIKTKNKTTVDLDGIEVLNFVSPAIGK